MTMINFIVVNFVISKYKIVWIALYVILFHSYFLYYLFVMQNANHSIVLFIISFHDLLKLLTMQQWISIII
jgi:hypothetical protein